MTEPIPSRRAGRFRALTLGTALFILLLSVCVAVLMGLQMVGMTFQPGWANGWPGGLSKHSVWAGVIAGQMSAAALGTGAAAVALPCHYLERRLGRAYIGWSAFVAVMLSWGGVVAFFAPRVFDWLRAAIAREWP